MGEQVGPDPARGPALALLTRARVAQELGWRVTGVHSSGRVLGGGATAPGWKRPAVPARVDGTRPPSVTRPQRRDRIDVSAAHVIGLAGLLRHLLPEHPVSLPGK